MKSGYPYVTINVNKKQCTAILPHVVTEPKVNRVKTDKRDAKRLGLILDIAGRIVVADYDDIAQWILSVFLQMSCV